MNKTKGVTTKFLTKIPKKKPSRKKDGHGHELSNLYRTIRVNNLIRGNNVNKQNYFFRW